MKTKTKVAHGTRSRYIMGCRCWRCLEADREYGREYRRRQRADELVPGTRLGTKPGRTVGVPQSEETRAKIREGVARARQAKQARKERS